MHRVILFITVVILISSSQARMTTELARQIGEASPNEMVPCIVVMRTVYPFGEMKRAMIKNRIEAFKGIARESQVPLVNWLSTKGTAVEGIKQYWVLNGLFLKATPVIIDEISRRPDVAKVYHDEVMSIVTPTASETAAMNRGIAWGVRKIEADKCWDEGYTGQGVIIGIIDTGVDSKHPALKDKWSGHWFVGSGMPQTDEPYDDNKHGTHCMGSILGGDGYGSFEQDIGVAPGAKYAAAKGLNSGGSGSSNVLVSCLEFMADLKSTVDIKAVSNSWAGNGGSDYYFEVVQTLKSLNIVPIFANGNNGSQGSGSVQSPGDYPHVIGVGATDSLDGIADFSSLGPAPDKDPYNDRNMWFRADWDFIKPNISAPGKDIYSCVPDGEYSNLSGTSMATPHLCGVVALLFQKNLNLTPEMVYNLLLDNADKPAGAGSYPNNTFGWGRVNAWKSIQATPTMDQPWIYVSKREMADLQPGNTVDLTITVTNLGGSDASGTTGKLIALDNYVSVSNANYTFGDLKPKDEATNSGNPYKITAHSLTPQGHQGVLGLILHADGEHDTLDYDDTVEISFVIGTAPEPYMIFEEDFEYSGGVDSFSIYWNTSGNWDYATDDCHSTTHSATSGDYTGTNSFTLKSGINLSTYVKPKMVFWSADKCDWPEDWKKVEISASTNGGSDWEEIFSFGGTDRSNSGEWSSHVVPLESFTQNNVSFKFEVGGIGSVDDATFWIDDISLQVPFDNAPPYFANTTLWRETHLTGPFDVLSTITDMNGVEKAELHYRVGSGSWSTLTMNSQGPDVYKAAIPAQTGHGTIDYYLEATDKWFAGTANTGTFPVGAGQSSGYHSFIYGSTDIVNNQQRATFSFKNPQNSNGTVYMQFVLPVDMKVTLSVFDVRGRVVVNLVNKNIKKGSHSLTWNSSIASSASGLYFIHFHADPLITSPDMKSIKKIERILMVK